MTSAERWLPIPGYEGAYEVSDHGRVRSLDRLDPRGRRVRGRMLRPGLRNGYQFVDLHDRDGVGRTWAVHRLVIRTFVGEAPSPDMEVCHNDGVRDNNLLSNLRWGTRSDNVQDAMKHGTHHVTSRTQCINGHPYDEANTRIDSRGSRQCQTCSRARWMATNAARFAGPGCDAEIRVWAKANGIECSPRGRVPGAIREAHAAAQSEDPGDRLVARAMASALVGRAL